MTIWTGHFRTGGLGVVVPSLGLSDPPDLSPLVSFLWNAMMNLVYNMPFNSEMELMMQISIAAAMIREMPGIFEHVCQSMPCLCAYIYIPMAAILNFSCDVFMSYFYFFIL